MSRQAFISGFAVGGCCVAVWGCGGGSSNDDDSAPVSGVSVGTITGFGSVVVNGIRFDDRAATVTINDRVATSAQPRVGMVVAVDGRVSACPNADVALCDGVVSQIHFGNNLEGPITSRVRLRSTRHAPRARAAKSRSPDEYVREPFVPERTFWSGERS